jgi:hypothetical protein
MLLKVMLISLADSGVIWTWPEFTSDTFWGLILFFIGFVVVIKAIQFIFSKQSDLQKGWNNIQSTALKKGFSTKELRILRDFYSTLSILEKQSAAKEFTKGWFKGKLFRYLVESSGIDPENSVALYDKLYSKSGNTEDSLLEIHTAADLLPGEAVSIEWKNEAHLTYITKVVNGDVYLSTYGWKNHTSPKDASMYAFRPRVGGFLIHGKLGALVGGESIIFHSSGEAEKKGDQHLMLNRPTRVRFRSLPRVEEQHTSIHVHNPIDLFQDEDSPSHKPSSVQDRILEERARKEAGHIDHPKASSHSSHEQKHEPSHAENIDFEIIAEKVSDRGIAFHLPDSISVEKIRQKSEFEAELTIDGYYFLKCTGKMVLGHNLHSSVFKFTSVKEEQRKEIYEVIKKAGGSRESLT